MSPVDRRLSGEMLSFSLAEEIATLRGQLDAASNRIARTLIKNAPLTVTLVGVKPGGALQEHTATGPITIQVLEGSMELTWHGSRSRLEAGALITLDDGVPHSVSSTEGAIFLLTVVGIPAS